MRSFYIAAFLLAFTGAAAYAVPAPNRASTQRLRDSVGEVLVGDRDALVIVSAATGAKRRITPGGFRFYAAVAWSPNHKQVAFSAGDLDHLGLFLASRDGTKTRTVVLEGDHSEGPAECPVWDATGRRMIFSRGFVGSPAQLFLFDARTQEVRELRLHLGRRQLCPVDWSAAGSIASLVRRCDECASSGVETMRSDGTHRFRVPNTRGASWADLDRTGRRLLFTTGSQPRRVFRINVDGSNRRLVAEFDVHATEDFRSAAIALSPDESEIAYIASDLDKVRIHSLLGGDERVLATSLADTISPAIDW